MSPKNTGHGSRREDEGPSVGVFAAQRTSGGDFDRPAPAHRDGPMKRLCRCGHPKSDHTGRLTNGEGWKILSTTACLAGTQVAGAGRWYAERVGGDRCREWQFSLRRTLRTIVIPPEKSDS